MNVRRSVLLATVMLGVALGLTAIGAGPALAVGGPVILGGDDLTDHGSFDTGTNQNEDGWLYIQKALENLKPNVTRANDGSVAALGSSASTATAADAGAAIGRAASAAGLTVTYHDGATAIEQFFTDLRAGTAKPAIIWIAGNGATNDLDASEGTALANNATTIADFVNSGGGLLSHGDEYGWLSGLLPGATNVASGGDGDLALTPQGQSAFPGLTDADVNTGPWHSHFEGNLGGLGVLVRSTSVQDNTGANAPVIIGGAAVVLPGSITLEPATATNQVGTSHTVTATVRNNTGALAAGVTVNFSVTAGPNSGQTGSGTTNASGQATFSYTGSGGTGTDTISASFTDAGGTVRTATASKTWTTTGSTTTTSTHVDCQLPGGGIGPCPSTTVPRPPPPAPPTTTTTISVNTNNNLNSNSNANNNPITIGGDTINITTPPAQIVVLAATGSGGQSQSQGQGQTQDQTGTLTAAGSGGVLAVTGSALGPLALLALVAMVLGNLFRVAPDGRRTYPVRRAAPPDWGPAQIAKAAGAALAALAAAVLRALRRP